MVARCVQNVINYLDGSDYDASTLFEDIDVITKYQINQIYYEGQEIVHRLYLQLIETRTKEAVDFYNAIYKTYPSKIMEKVSIYSTYPFKGSRDPKADRDLITKMLNIKFDNGTDEIISLISLLLHHGKVKIDPSFEDIIYNIVGNYGLPGGPLDIDSMKHAIYVGRLGNTPYPNNKEDAKDFFNNSNSRESTCYYGEYLAMEYIMDHLVDGDIVIWVSKNLGDGYGYDILVHNPEKNRYIAYEVKAHILKEEFLDVDFDIELTSTENTVRYDSQISDNNYEYHVIEVYINKEIPGFKLAHEVQLMDDCYYDQNGEWVREVVANNIINQPNPVGTIKREKRI